MATLTRSTPHLALTVAIVGLLLVGLPVADAKGRPTLGQKPAAASDPISRYLRSANPVEYKNQLELDAYKSWLIRQPGIYQAGFVESANWAKTRSTTLLWAGKSNLQRVATTEGARRDIAVSIRHVRYTRSELQAGVDWLWASQDSPRWHDFVIGSIAATDLHHDGLTVQGYFKHGTTATPARVADATSAARYIMSQARLARARGSGVAPIAGSDIVVTARPKPQLYATRTADTEPFYGGGMMLGHVSTDCSNGFGIILNGRKRVTTAQHCADTPYRTFGSPYNNYGSTITTVPSAGGRVLAATSSYFVYDGGWNNKVGYAKPTVAFQDLSINDSVCTDGAESGVHCGVQVDNLLVSFNDLYSTFWTIRGIQRIDGTIAAAEGDSGGPVLVPYLPDSATIGAAGMIQGSLGVQTTNCGSIRSPGRNCSLEVEFTSMHTFVNNLPGAKLYVRG